MIIPPEHPALAGHFPGEPIVPGVVLLDEIARNAREGHAAPDTQLHIPWVKFHAPLLPGEEFAIHLEPLGAASFKFTVRSAQTLVASGTLKFE